MGTLLTELRKLTLGTKEVGLFKHIFKEDPLLGALPTKRISSDPYYYQREKTRPPVGPVGSEGEFIEGTPEFDELSVKLKRFGGQVPYDDLDINATADGDPRSSITEQLAMATIEEVSRLLIYGDESTNALHWNGLRKLSTLIPATQKYQIADATTNVLALRDFWKAETLLRAGKAGAFYMGPTAFIPTIKDKLGTNTAAAEKMLPNFGRPVLHIGPYPYFPNDHLLITENGTDSAAGTFGSIYLVGAGPQAFMAVIPNSGDKAARVQTIGPREKKGGSIVRAEIQMGFALHSAYGMVRMTGIDPAK